MKAPATRPVMNGYRTMRMLHWSSTSFGYMYPWTACSTSCIFSISVAYGLALKASGQSLPTPRAESLPHRSVERVVVDLRASRHLRLQHLDFVVAHEGVDRVARVL